MAKKTYLKMRDAELVGHSFSTLDGMYEVTIRCPKEQLDGVICQTDHLNVEIEYDE